jgi:hypothetical protein
MKINYKYLSTSCWLVWISFISFLFLDVFGIFGLKDIGFLESLQTSSLARGMFYDIGILSTIICAWIAFGTKHKFRYFFAIAGLFVGGLAILPFLGIYFASKEQGIVPLSS